MATLAVACAAIGADDAWALTAGATKMIAVAAPDDDTTSMLSTSTLNASQGFTLTPGARGGMETIQQIQVVHRLRENGADTAIAARPFLKLGGNTTNGTPVSPNGTTWITTTETLARPGGGTWQPIDLDTLEVGIQETTDSANSIQITTLYIVVTYQPHAGGFGYLVASLVPFFIGALNVCNNAWNAGANSCSRWVRSLWGGPVRVCA